MEKSIVVHDENHELTMVNETDMDFRIPGLAHSVVKHAQSTRVRQLIQKIENHPNRHPFQQDQRQNQSSNPISPKSKPLIRDVGNIELCELLGTEPKAQCKICLSYWNIGIVYCTCGHFLRKGKKRISYLTNIRLFFFQILSTSSRKGDVSRTPIWLKSREIGKIILPYSWRKNARISSSRISMIDSNEMNNCANEWLNMIETKMFVDKWMILRTKIMPFRWHHKNITITRVIGDWLQTRQVPILCQWNADLISNKH